MIVYEHTNSRELYGDGYDDGRAKSPNDNTRYLVVGVVVVVEVREMEGQQPNDLSSLALHHKIPPTGAIYLEIYLRPSLCLSQLSALALQHHN